MVFPYLLLNLKKAIFHILEQVATGLALQPKNPYLNKLRIGCVLCPLHSVP